MLRALQERGITPSLVLGSSAGAVNGAWYALYPQRMDDLERVWLTLRTRTVFPGTPLQVGYNFFRGGHAHHVGNWHRILLQHFSGCRIENAAYPLGVVAVRLSDGAVTVFNHGDVVRTLLASTAIPGLFPPQSVDGELYVDGGVVEFLPIPGAVARGADVVYALDCSDFPEGDGTAGLTVDRCGQIAATAWVERVVANARATGVRIHLLRPPLGNVLDGRDFQHSARLIAAGYEYARQASGNEEPAQSA